MPTAKSHTRVILIGVDAGASRNTALAAGKALKPLARASGGPAAVRPGTVPQSARAILDSVRRVLSESGVDRAAALVVGAAGAGRDPERSDLERALAEAGVAGAVRVTTDIEIALAAAFGEGAGILLLAGTGSGACARLPSGEIQRTGGHGWQFGDEGSGYALARSAVAAVGRAGDGRGPGTALVAALAQAAGVAADPNALLEWARNVPRPAVADLAATVQQTAGQGDAVAQLLVEAAARELVLHVRVLRSRFPGGGAVPLAMAGGVVRAQTPVRQAVTRLLEHESPALELRDDLVEPARGALRLARDLVAR